MYSPKKIFWFTNSRNNYSRLSLNLVTFILLLWFLGIISEVFISIDESAVYTVIFFKKTYSLVCHQDVDKLINIWGFKTLVCARCFGIYSGALLISLASFFGFIGTYKPPITMFLSSVVLMAIDSVSVTLGIYDYSIVSAFITGFIFGSITIFYIFESIKTLSLKKSVHTI